MMKSDQKWLDRSTKTGAHQPKSRSIQPSRSEVGLRCASKALTTVQTAKKGCSKLRTAAMWKEGRSIWGMSDEHI